MLRPKIYIKISAPNGSDVMLDSLEAGYAEIFRAAGSNYAVIAGSDWFRFFCYMWGNADARFR